MGDKNRGIHQKFVVERTDGTSNPGKRHHGCEYFVLDLHHDPHAIPAIRAYAESCGRDGYELLARDLLERVAKQGAEPSVMSRVVSLLGEQGADNG